MPEAVTDNNVIQIHNAENPTALQALVQRCTKEDLPIIDYGFAHTNLGHPAPSKHVKLQQHGQVIEHYEQDLTVRIAAGATFGHIQAQLRPTNQFLPVDADADLTLGEVINHNVYGPLRVKYGAARELLLGMRCMDGTGRDIHTGGRTVKNVSGYDLTRFMVGSLGQMGIIYEATMRTYAIPQHILRLTLRIDDPAWLDTHLSNWLLDVSAPSTLALAYEEEHWTLQIAYFGTTTGCNIQHRALKSFWESSVPEPQMVQLDEYLDESSQHRAWRRQASTLVKIIVPPATTGSTCLDLVSSTRINAALRFDVLPVHGCILVGGDLPAAQAIMLDKQINQIIAQVGGVRQWHARPLGTNSIAPFGPAQPDWSILKKLKDTMDPRALLNRGRFLETESSLH